MLRAESFCVCTLTCNILGHISRKRCIFRLHNAYLKQLIWSRDIVTTVARCLVYIDPETISLLLKNDVHWRRTLMISFIPWQTEIQHNLGSEKRLWPWMTVLNSPWIWRFFNSVLWFSKLVTVIFAQPYNRTHISDVCTRIVPQFYNVRTKSMTKYN